MLNASPNNQWNADLQSYLPDHVAINIFICPATCFKVYKFMAKHLTGNVGCNCKIDLVRRNWLAISPIARREFLSCLSGSTSSEKNLPIFSLSKILE